MTAIPARLFSLLLCLTPALAPPLAATQATAQEAPRLAKIITLEDHHTTITRRFFGQVAARETVDMAFQVGGQILRFPVSEGQPVTQGGLVAELDMEPFDLALRQARSQQEQADRTLKRLEQLKDSVASQVRIDDARTNAELAAIATRNAERSHELATLHAPFDGLVAVRLVPNFSTISAGTPVVRLHDMSELHININVPEVLFQRSNEGAPAEIWAEFPRREGQFPLTVREFAAETSAVGQTIAVTLTMTQPEGQLITPGSSATVYARLPVQRPGPTVPLAAIVTDNSGAPHVMVFEPTGADQGSLRRVPVTIEPAQDGTVRLLSGVEPGQEVVGTGAAYLSDGDTVRRFSGFPN